ncbi:MAG TPA: mycofactocin biosynthesis glycosyltransferase MftF [Solirubrobacteraceae bacterium]|nr:mycofactocin biosynthesis glycosyltransferase MftF [Solirubrobacteraceae bacterium]
MADRPPDAEPVPPGWRVHLATGVQVLRDGELLLGGSPLRALTLSARGAALVSGWLVGQPVSDDQRERALARRLLDAGLVHPDPPARAPDAIKEVTVVVPVYADPERLRACLAPLAGGPSVVVVDDGSPDPDPIAAAAEEVGARYVRHTRNRGPSAARNTGLQQATTPLVAFLDADCVPPAGFPRRLLDHLADPAVGLVAPRITSSDRGLGPIAAYERSRSALDMGPRPARVRPYSTVWYVPSAAMLARRAALGRGFDEGLVLGEDVDLVWRLHDAGWQVRYDPAVAVAHEDRVRPTAWLRRRVAYNESVAPLLTRHPERVPVLFLSPPAALAWAASLGGGSLVPLLALTGFRAARLRRTLAAYVPRAATRAGRISLEITAREGRDLARAVVGPWAPFALAAVAAAPHKRRGLAGRFGALLGAMAIGDWLTDRPALDPFRYAALRLADESTRGLGIWLGCARARDFRGLLPRQPPPASLR